MPSRQREDNILSFLSHGKKRRKEIISFIATVEGEEYDDVEDAVDNKLDKLRKWDQIEKESSENSVSVFYYRGEIGKEIIRPRPSADKENIDQILTQFKYSFDLQSKDDPTRTPDREAKPALLENLYHSTLMKRDILPNKKMLETFESIFEVYTKRIVEQSKGKDDKTTIETDNTIEYQLLFQITSNLVMNAKKGLDNIDIISKINPHLDTLHGSIHKLPVPVGTEVQALARSIDTSKGQRIFLDLISNSSYENDLLAEMAFYSYDVHNEIDILFSDIENVEMNASTPKEKEKIRNFSEYITTLYQSSNI